MQLLEKVINTQPPSSLPQSMPSQSKPGAGLQVLVVEDNPINQKVASGMLRKLGATVDCVNNGEEGLTAIKVKKYDIVFMDCNMPVLDGYECTKQIRLWEKETNRLKVVVVAMTANAVDGDREKCIQAGMDDYVSKPIKIQKLEAIFYAWGEGMSSFGAA